MKFKFWMKEKKEERVIDRSKVNNFMSMMRDDIYNGGLSSIFVGNNNEKIEMIRLVTVVSVIDGANGISYNLKFDSKTTFFDVQKHTYVLYSDLDSWYVEDYNLMNILMNTIKSSFEMAKNQKISESEYSYKMTNNIGDEDTVFKSRLEQIFNDNNFVKNNLRYVYDLENRILNLTAKINELETERWNVNNRLFELENSGGAMKEVYSGDMIGSNVQSRTDIIDLGGYDACCLKAAGKMRDGSGRPYCNDCGKQVTLEMVQSVT